MKKEATAALYELLDSLTDLSVAERLTFIRKLLINYQKDRKELVFVHKGVLFGHIR